MRSRMPAALVAALLATGAPGLAGCGSDSSVGDRVPKSTPDLTVPAGAEVLGNNAAATTTTPTTSTSTTGADTTGTTPASATGGGATTTSAAPAPAPTPAPAAPTQTQAPSGGTGG